MPSPTQDPAIIDTLGALLEAQEDAAVAYSTALTRLVHECCAEQSALPPSVQDALREVRKAQLVVERTMHAVGEHDV